MKVISVTLARSMWLLDPRTLNAQGRSLLDTLLATSSRYRFAKSPQHLLDLNAEKALEFVAGTFEIKGEPKRVGLIVYNNGLTADSLSSTDDSDAFLEDLTQWLTKEHKLAIQPDGIIRKYYYNQLEVECEYALSLLNPKLQRLSEKISSLCLTLDGSPRSFEMAALGIWPQDVGEKEAPPGFRFERKIGAPLSKNLYFSQAPLRTQEHISVLEELEAILASR
jgi:hypothetical protein